MSGISIQELVAKNLKYYRIKKGLSQENLSKVCGLSVRFISRAETTPQNLTLETLQTIAAALGVAVADLTASLDGGKKGTPAKSSKKAAEALDETIKLLQAYRSMMD